MRALSTRHVIRKLALTRALPFLGEFVLRTSLIDPQPHIFHCCHSLKGVIDHSVEERLRDDASIQSATAIVP